jgi:hypothetical protein
VPFDNATLFRFVTVLDAKDISIDSSFALPIQDQLQEFLITRISEHCKDVLHEVLGRNRLVVVFL